MAKTASFVVGIDLGTTNFAISVIKNGRPHMIEDAQQNRTFPSAVFRKDGQWQVGHAAKVARLKEPHLGAYAVKRLMGLRFDSEERPILADALGLTIVALEDGLCGVQLGEEVFTPSDIAAQILQFSFDLVKKQFGANPEEVVITVPAYFNHAQRKATKLAAEKAKLPCQRIINEPTAAAIAYGMRVSQQSKVVVFDLGGGTFDISILQFASGIVETLGISGDAFLGGEDFDNALVHHCLKHIEDFHGVDLSTNRVALRRLKEACETAKCELSFQQSTMIMLPQIHPNIDFQTTISRNLLNSLTDPLVDRTIDVVRQALEDASLKTNEVDKVILVGGQTRMPRVRERISGFFKQDPSKGVHPDEVVAKGAALHAASLLGEVDAPMLFDVTPFNLGIDVQAGLFQNIIAKNARIPVSASETFVLQMGKKSVTIVVRQGHSRFSTENEFLGEFRVGNLELRGDGVAELDIAFRLDGNGMLHVSAKDVVSGRTVEMKMRNYGEFIREDEEFDEVYTSEKAQIGIGDSSASKANRGLDIQIQHRQDAPTVNDKTQEVARKMREVMAITELDDVEPTIMDMEEFADPFAIEGEEEDSSAGIQITLGGSASIPTVGIKEEYSEEDEIEAEESLVVGAAVSETDDTSLSDDSEETILVTDIVDVDVDSEDSEEVLLLGELEIEDLPEVGLPDMAVADDALNQLLHSGFDNDILLPQDDFFAGLTAAVTGQSIQDVLNTMVIEEDVDLIESDELSHLSTEMKMILEELFTEI